MPVTERARAVRPVQPGGYARTPRHERTVIACSILKGVHRWAQPFVSGDTCACGALRLGVDVGSAAYEVHDE